jgi:hypothetical protein
VGGSLEARPAEVLDDPVGGIGDAVELLVDVPADVGHPDLVGAGPGGEAERVAQAVGDDAPGLGRVRADERVAGTGRAGVGVEAQDGAVVAERVGRAEQVL